MRKERIQKQNRRFNKYGAIKMMQHAETFVIGIPEKKSPEDIPFYTYLTKGLGQ